MKLHDIQVNIREIPTSVMNIVDEESSRRGSATGSDECEYQINDIFTDLDAMKLMNTLSSAFQNRMDQNIPIWK